MKRPAQVTIHDRGTTVVLPCGLVIEGRPQSTASYAATARELGYGDYVLAMCQEHDSLHVALCRWLGLSDSYSMRHAAGLPVDPEIAAIEEAAVMAVQRFARRVGVRVREVAGC